MKQNKVAPETYNDVTLPGSDVVKMAGNDVTKTSQNSDLGRPGWEMPNGGSIPINQLNGTNIRVSVTIRNEVNLANGGPTGNHVKTEPEVLSRSVNVNKTEPDLPPRPPTANSVTRKSAWERAQERHQEELQAAAAAPSPTLTLPVVPHPDDDSDDSLSRPSAIYYQYRTSVKQIFKSKRFTDAKLELLYQRYFFKLNQKNLSMLMALLGVICLILILFHYLGGSKSPLLGLALGAVVVSVVALEAVSTRSHLSAYHMEVVTYLFLVLLGVTVVMVTVVAHPRTASEGVWVTMFAVYMSYSLLPVRMRISVAVGISLSVIHIICACAINWTDPFLWKQVSVRFLYN